METMAYAALVVAKPFLASRQPQSSSLALASAHTLSSPSKILSFRRRRKGVSSRGTALAVKAEFDIGLFERDLEGSSKSRNSQISSADFPELEDKEEEPPCPPGLRKYETMMVLRPDMSEDERLTLTKKYEELLVAGGGMYVEVFNRGVIPLAYGIRKKNKAGESNTYLDGIYLLFTYFTKPDSVALLTETLLTDDNVIRSSSFKIRKRRLF